MKIPRPLPNVYFDLVSLLSYVFFSVLVTSNTILDSKSSGSGSRYKNNQSKSMEEESKVSQSMRPRNVVR